MSESAQEYVLSVHIGVSSRHAAILDFSGRVLLSNESHDLPQERGGRKYPVLLQEAIESVEALIVQAQKRGVSKDQIVGGGAVVPASVDSEHGYVRLPPGIQGMQNTYLARDLESGVGRILGREIHFWIENDANGAALAEWYFGCAKNVPDFAVILLCTGLGGGLFLDGRLRRGHTFMAGEIGHTTVQPDGPLCLCGGRGCLETLVSGRALLRMARAGCSPLATKKDLAYKDLIAAADDGEQEILGFFRTMGQYLGICIANLANTLNPTKIILTGHLASAARFLRPAAEEEVRNRMFAGMDCGLEISTLLNNLEVLAGLGTFRYHSGKKDDPSNAVNSC
jgi:predicted NBD/HSP70 family sugar kinase